MPAPLPIGFPPPTEVGVIEVKQYPEYRAVTYTHEGEAQVATRVAFNPLFEHISRNQIAMTVPVEARYYDDSRMPSPPTPPLKGGIAQFPMSNVVEVSFLYAHPEISPESIDPRVKVVDYPAMMAVSIGLVGPYTWESYQTNLQGLRTFLAEHPQYEIVGPPRRLLYNSPMTPAAIKRSEVQIPIAIVGGEVRSLLTKQIEVQTLKN